MLSEAAKMARGTEPAVQPSQARPDREPLGHLRQCDAGEDGGEPWNQRHEIVGDGRAVRQPDPGEPARVRERRRDGDRQRNQNGGQRQIESERQADRRRPITLATAIRCRMPKKTNESGVKA